jgi:uncharacterized protein YhbP (UPF0306 family)
MNIKFAFGHKDHDDNALNESISVILNAAKLLSMATVRSEGVAHINTAYFAFDDALRLFIITDPESVHGRNLVSNHSVAVTVFDSQQEFWTPLRGLQLFGTCQQTPLMGLPHALNCFLGRFPVFSELVRNPADFATKAVTVKLHTITVERLKLFDEPTFGEEVYIDLNIPRR